MKLRETVSALLARQSAALSTVGPRGPVVAAFDSGSEGCALTSRSELSESKLPIPVSVLHGCRFGKLCGSPWMAANLSSQAIKKNK